MNSSLASRRFLCLRHVSRAWTRSGAPPFLTKFKSPVSRIRQSWLMVLVALEVTRNRAARFAMLSGSCSNAYLETHSTGFGRSCFCQLISQFVINFSRDAFPLVRVCTRQAKQAIGVWHLATEHVLVIYAENRRPGFWWLCRLFLRETAFFFIATISSLLVFNEARLRELRRSLRRRRRRFFVACANGDKFNYFVVIRLSAKGSLSSLSIALCHHHGGCFFIDIVESHETNWWRL